MPIKIRKQVYELTPKDLASTPIWEFALDEEGEPGQDEATVRPHTCAGDLDPSDGMFIVSANFSLSDGSQLRGYLTPPILGDRKSGDRTLGAIQPVIVTEKGQAIFWWGRCPPNLGRAYETLSRNAADVFPIRFETAAPLVGGPVSGLIPGFLCLEDGLEGVSVIQ